MRASLVPNNASSVVLTTAIFVVSVEFVLFHGSTVYVAQIQGLSKEELTTTG